MDGYLDEIREEAKSREADLLEQLESFKETTVLGLSVEAKEKRVAKIQAMIKEQNYTVAEDLLARSNTFEEEQEEMIEEDFLKEFLDHYDDYYQPVATRNASFATLVSSRTRNKEQRGAKRLADNWLPGGSKLGEEKLENLLNCLGFKVADVKAQNPIGKFEHFSVQTERAKGGQRDNYELLKAAVQSEGVISLFDSKKSAGENFSLFDPAVLEEISKMKEKNIAVEILKKLMAEQVSLYKRTNVVQSQKFSEKISQLMNAYYNGLISNEEVIKELLKTAEEISNLYKNGQKLGLSQEELAFYDALTKPEHIKDFYQNDELVALTKELTEMLRKNRTIDWQKKETARATMRKMVKRLLKKYKYPPEDYDFAINTVISQCELWTDNASMV